jgi:predicted dehydrogenase
VIGIAVIGAGHWGPNLIRNFYDNDRSRVVWVCDLDRSRLDAARRRYPGVGITVDAAEAIADPAVEAVVVATPTRTHHRWVREALERGRHVFVEKPLAACRAEAEELAELAVRAGRVLLVDHVFLYNPAVARAKAYLDAGELGRVRYVSSVRTNLGPVRVDVSAAWDLAAQDVAILDDWLGALPETAAASGGTWLNPGIEDAVFATLRYPGNVLAHLHCSWLHPHKTREIVIVGEHRMLSYDDTNVAEPIRLYDKRIAEQRAQSLFVDTIEGFRSVVRDGDVLIPRVVMGEPLRAACEHFLDCVEKGERPRTDGRLGADVVRVLEAVERSLRAGGREEAV